MAMDRLFVFVEGDDDERFIRSVCLGFLEQRYEQVSFVRYARMPK